MLYIYIMKLKKKIIELDAQTEKMLRHLAVDDKTNLKEYIQNTLKKHAREYTKG